MSTKRNYFCSICKERIFNRLPTSLYCKKCAKEMDMKVKIMANKINSRKRTIARNVVDCVCECLDVKLEKISKKRENMIKQVVNLIKCIK